MKKENFIQKHFLTLLSIIGLVMTFVLTYLYYRANFLESSGNSFCSINNYINCDKVEKSSFSTFFGMPLAVYGFGFYSFVLFVKNIMPKISFFDEFKNYNSYIFGASFFAVLSSFYLAYISYFQIHALCLLCSFTYILNILIFGFSSSGASLLAHIRNCFIDMKKLFATKSKIIFTLTLVLLVASIVTYVNASGIFMKKNESSPTGISEIKITKPVTINLYTDYECPYCQLAHIYFLQLEQNYPKVKVIHHDFPFSKKCNKYVDGYYHKNACDAILYAKAAKKQGQFRQYSTMLFLNQENLDSKNLIELAKNSGININKLKADIKSPEFAKEISEDVERGHKLGVEATPTYFIGTHKYEGVTSYEELVNNVKQGMN